MSKAVSALARAYARANVRMRPPASERDVENHERRLGRSIPAALKALYRRV